MNGYLTDSNGNKSSKRLLQVITTLSGIVLSYIVCIMALVRGNQDIGSNAVFLISMLVGAGIAGGVGTAFANKGETGSKDEAKS